MPALHRAIASQADVVLHETHSTEEATARAEEALREGVETIVAAGGDGTINAVVNGLSADFSKATLGVIPLGTGNDLARTLALPMKPLAALELLTSGVARHLDVIQFDAAGQRRYGLNMAIGGFTGQMGEILTDDLKSSWGPLAYLIGAAEVLPDLKTYYTDIQLDGQSSENHAVLNIAVANGRTAGGGLQVAPCANPEDGWLDVVIVSYTSLLNLADITTRFLAGAYLESEDVIHHQVQHLQVKSTPGMWFNLDGELLTNKPVTLTVQPQTLRVVVGPDYTPEGHAV
jgi:diacylglycerol kinase (ATP)